MVDLRQFMIDVSLELDELVPDLHDVSPGICARLVNIIQAIDAKVEESGYYK